MPIIPFIGGHYQGRSPNVNSQETINLFPELDQEGGKAIMALAGSPGLLHRFTCEADTEVRGYRVVGDYLYVVQGNKLYKVDKLFNITTLKNSLGSLGETVWMEDCGTYLMIVDGANGYYHQIGMDNLQKITDPEFPIPSSLTYQDSRFIVSAKDTGNFYQSALKDPTNWNGLEFAQAEGHSDPLYMVLSDHRELWLLGKYTTEVYQNTGGADFSFSRVGGGFIEWGIAGPRAACKLDNGVMWLTDKGQFVRALSYNPQIVSTRQIEYMISKYSRMDDVIAFSMIFEGHAWAWFTFPSAGITWIYDASSQLWHVRHSFKTAGDTTQGRHRANCAVFFNNEWLVGDWTNGKTYALKSDVYDDDGEAIRAVRTGQVIENTKDPRRWAVVNRCELDMETGVGTATGQGEDPMAMLQFSKDGGHTWGVERWKSMGKQGEYDKEVYWNQCGRYRAVIPRIIITDPVKRYISGMRLYIDWEE
jgi:hypothetical protein